MSVIERATKVYEGSRIPSPIPTVLQVDPAEHPLDDILRVNFGPNHPSTHGVLRIVLKVDGERIVYRAINSCIRFLPTVDGKELVTVESLDTPYYVKRYIGAKRLLFEENEVEN